MRDFSNVNKVIFPKNLFNDGMDFLEEVGLEGYEAVILFLGKGIGNIMEIMELFIPVQTAYKTEHGLLYEVSTDELERLDDYLFDNQLSLFCQVHTHPGRAYHSDTDDALCIVTKNGGLSIVIPNFAKRPVPLQDCAYYRFRYRKGWLSVPFSEIINFIEFS